MDDRQIPMTPDQAPDQAPEQPVNPIVDFRNKFPELAKDKTDAQIGMKLYDQFGTQIPEGMSRSDFLRSLGVHAGFGSAMATGANDSLFFGYGPEATGATQAIGTAFSPTALMELLHGNHEKYLDLVKQSFKQSRDEAEDRKVNLAQTQPWGTAAGHAAGTVAQFGAISGLEPVALASKGAQSVAGMIPEVGGVAGRALEAGKGAVDSTAEAIQNFGRYGKAALAGATQGAGQDVADGLAGKGWSPTNTAIGTAVAPAMEFAIAGPAQWKADIARVAAKESPVGLTQRGEHGIKAVGLGEKEYTPADIDKIQAWDKAMYDGTEKYWDIPAVHKQILALAETPQGRVKLGQAFPEYTGNNPAEMFAGLNPDSEAGKAAIIEATKRIMGTNYKPVTDLPTLRSKVGDAFEHQKVDINDTMPKSTPPAAQAMPTNAPQPVPTPQEQAAMGLLDAANPGRATGTLRPTGTGEQPLIDNVVPMQPRSAGSSAVEPSPTAMNPARDVEDLSPNQLIRYHKQAYPNEPIPELGDRARDAFLPQQQTPLQNPMAFQNWLQTKLYGYNGGGLGRQGFQESPVTYLVGETSSGAKPGAKTLSGEQAKFSLLEQKEMLANWLRTNYLGAKANVMQGIADSPAVGTAAKAFGTDMIQNEGDRDKVLKTAPRALSYLKNPLVAGGIDATNALAGAAIQHFTGKDVDPLGMVGSAYGSAIDTAQDAGRYARNYLTGNSYANVPSQEFIPQVAERVGMKEASQLQQAAQKGNYSARLFQLMQDPEFRRRMTQR